MKNQPTTYVVTWTAKNGAVISQSFTSYSDALALQESCVRGCRYDVRIIVQRFYNVPRIVRVAQ